MLHSAAVSVFVSKKSEHMMDADQTETLPEQNTENRISFLQIEDFLYESPPSVICSDCSCVMFNSTLKNQRQGSSQVCSPQISTHTVCVCTNLIFNMFLDTL